MVVYRITVNPFKCTNSEKKGLPEIYPFYHEMPLDNLGNIRQI